METCSNSNPRPRVEAIPGFPLPTWRWITANTSAEFGKLPASEGSIATTQLERSSVLSRLHYRYRRISFSNRQNSLSRTDNFGAGVNSRQSTIRDFSAAAVVTTYL